MASWDEALEAAAAHPTISVAVLVLSLVLLEWIKSGSKPGFLGGVKGE